MSLTTWNPFREIDAMFDRYNRTLARRLDAGSAGLVESHWSPSVDITETETQYLVTAELPGVEKKDMQVSVENGVLKLRGERRVEDEAKEAKLHRVERFYGQFSREFALPEDAETSAIQANAKEGVLKIRIPRAEVKAGQATQVEIR